MNCFHVLLLLLGSFIGWLGLAIIETKAYRGIHSMLKKLAFEIGGGVLLGLVLLVGPILDGVLRH